MVAQMLIGLRLSNEREGKGKRQSKAEEQRQHKEESKRVRDREHASGESMILCDIALLGVHTHISAVVWTLAGACSPRAVSRSISYTDLCRVRTLGSLFFVKTVEYRF